jgi:SAM-dependent methyltransferase
MNVSHTCRRSRRSLLTLVPAVVAISALSAFGQTQATKPVEPQSGQPGKDVVWVPTPQALVDKMLDVANVTPQDYVIDLGSGDGRTVITAAKRGATALGIEYNPDMVALSQRNAAAQGVSGKATFVKADLFESDFSKATVVTMFLLPTINIKLRPKILDLKPGTRIVSNAFDMGDWQPDDTVTASDCYQWCKALFWIVPAKVDGSWQLPQGDLTLTQSFQMVSGTLRSGSGTTPIVNGKLRGDQITFEAGGAQYTGRVSGETIQGTFKSGASTTNWQASRTRRLVEFDHRDE